jgi:Protein of unknown function (DUF3137)
MNPQKHTRRSILWNIIFDVWIIVCIGLFVLLIYRRNYSDQFASSDFEAIQLLLGWAIIIVSALSFAIKHLIIIMGRILFSNTNPDQDGLSWSITPYFRPSEEDKRNMPTKNLPEELKIYAPILNWCDRVIKYLPVYQNENIQGHFIHSRYEVQTSSEYWLVYVFSLPNGILWKDQYITLTKDQFNQPNYWYYKAIALPLVMMMIDGKAKSSTSPMAIKMAPLVSLYHQIAEMIWVNWRRIAIGINILYGYISYLILTYVLEKYRVKVKNSQFEQYFDIKSNIPQLAEQLINHEVMDMILKLLQQHNHPSYRYRMRLDGDTGKWYMIFDIAYTFSSDQQIQDKGAQFGSMVKQIADTI